MRWVAAYDVRHDSHRCKVASLLGSMGCRIQRSVFVLEADRGRIERLVETLAQLVDLRCDAVHVFPLCGPCDAGLFTIGQADALDRPEFWIV